MVSNWLKRDFGHTGSGDICLDCVGVKDPQAAEAWLLGCKLPLSHLSTMPLRPEERGLPKLTFIMRTPVKPLAPEAGCQACLMQLQSLWLGLVAATSQV